MIYSEKRRKNNVIQSILIRNWKIFLILVI